MTGGRGAGRGVVHAGLRSLFAASVASSLCAACASAHLPPPATVAEARATLTYSGSLRVSLKGPEFRGRTGVLLGFRRPDALRIEIPGPAGPRLVAVAREGALTAVFPGDRAIFEGRATADDLESLLGVALTPPELMDLLVGTASPRLRSYEARWRGALPRDITAVLPDGSRLRVTAEDVETGRDLPDLAFVAPPHDGFRAVNAGEARRLWGAR